MRMGAWFGFRVSLALSGALALGLAALFADATAQEVSPLPNAAKLQEATPELGPASPKGNTDRGAIVFRSGCGVCHRDPKKFAKRFKGPDPRVRGIPLDDYLATHHSPSAGPKRDLIAYLKAL